MKPILNNNAKSMKRKTNTNEQAVVVEGGNELGLGVGKKGGVVGGELPVITCNVGDVKGDVLMSQSLTSATLPETNNYGDITEQGALPTIQKVEYTKTKEISNIRDKPWSEIEQEEYRKLEHLRQVNKKNQSRPRYHQTEMHQEEAFQKRIARAKSRRSEASNWLIARVLSGRLELLDRFRSTGLEKEGMWIWEGEGGNVGNVRGVGHVLDRIWRPELEFGKVRGVGTEKMM